MCCVFASGLSKTLLETPKSISRNIFLFLLHNGVPVQLVSRWAKRGSIVNCRRLEGLLKSILNADGIGDEKVFHMMSKKKTRFQLPYSCDIEDIKRSLTIVSSIVKEQAKLYDWNQLGENPKDISSTGARLLEIIDCKGLEEASLQLAILKAAGGLNARQLRHLEYYTTYLTSVYRHYGKAQAGPFGYDVLPLLCDYSTKTGGNGRIYSIGNSCGPKKPHVQGQEDAKYNSTVEITGCPKVLRPFFVQRFAHDFDQANSQPEILRQLATQLTW